MKEMESASAQCEAEGEYQGSFRQIALCSGDFLGAPALRLVPQSGGDMTVDDFVSVNASTFNKPPKASTAGPQRIHHQSLADLRIQ
jgi:hypothetical protein